MKAGPSGIPILHAWNPHERLDGSVHRIDTRPRRRHRAVARRPIDTASRPSSP